MSLKSFQSLILSKYAQPVDTCISTSIKFKGIVFQQIVILNKI